MNADHKNESEERRELISALDGVRRWLGSSIVLLRIAAEGREIKFVSGADQRLTQSDISELRRWQNSPNVSTTDTALDLSGENVAFSVQLCCAATSTVVDLICVNPEVLPQDLLRNDELGSLLPWAALAINPRLDSSKFVIEAIAGVAPRAYLRAICHEVDADSAILWMLEPLGRRPRMKAEASWGLQGNIAQFDIPQGRGIIGKISARTPISLYSLDEQKPYNPDLVDAQGWLMALVVPIVGGGQLIGALSLYSRSRFDQLSLDRIRNLDVQTTAIQFVRRFRKNAIQLDRDKLIEARMERLQIGVELLGFAHDLAESAERTADHAKVLNTGLANSNLSPAIQQTLLDLAEDADLVHKFTRAMNRIARQRRHEITEFDVQEKIEEILPILQAMSEAVDISRVHRHLRLRGDPLDLQRIIINLVSNSRNWTSEASAEIVVVAGRFIDENRGLVYVDLEVRDNGSGMSPRVRRNAANILFTTRKNGLGLGLFVVKLLAERFGGTLTIVRSEPSLGTDIRVRLPSAEGSSWK